MFSFSFRVKDVTSYHDIARLKAGKLPGGISKGAIIRYLFILLLIPISVRAEDVILAQWVRAEGATSYKIYQSNELICEKITWNEGIDIGNELNYTFEVPDNALILWRISAVNEHGETINRHSGAWYYGDWQLPQLPTGLNVK